MVNSLNRQAHGEAMCYRHYLLQYLQLAAPKEILFSLSLHVHIPETIHKLSHPHCGEGTWEKGKHLCLLKIPSDK